MSTYGGFFPTLHYYNVSIHPPYLEGVYLQGLVEIFLQDLLDQMTCTLTILIHVAKTLSRTVLPILECKHLWEHSWETLVRLLHLCNSKEPICITFFTHFYFLFSRNPLPSFPLPTPMSVSSIFSKTGVVWGMFF